MPEIWFLMRLDEQLNLTNQDTKIGQIYHNIYSVENTSLKLELF